MNKKIVITLMIIIMVALLTVSGCAKKNAVPVDAPSALPEQKQDNPVASEKEPEKKNDERDMTAVDHLADARKGKLSGLDITFDDTLAKVIRIMGQPDEISSWQGADLYIYDDIIGIYIDPFDEIVTGLSAGIGFETYGIKIGMTVDLVKEILGEPDFEGISYESGVPALEYVAGNFLVEIIIDEQSRQTVGLTLYNYSN